jgi:hypothetical protein
MVEYTRLLNKDFLNHLGQNWTRQDTITAAVVLGVILVVVFWITKK